MKLFLLLLSLSLPAFAQNLGIIEESVTHGSSWTASAQYGSQVFDGWVRCNYVGAHCTAGPMWAQNQITNEITQSTLASRTYDKFNEQTEHWVLKFDTPQFWEVVTLPDDNIGPAFWYDNRVVADGGPVGEPNFELDFSNIPAPMPADFAASAELKRTHPTP